MSDPQGVIRVNISVPRDLKAQMEAVKQPVNWSAVAVEAFRGKLLEIDSRKEVRGMDEVIQRLKAAKELEGKEAYQEGKEAGEAWAKGAAMPSQLEALSELEDSHDLRMSGGWADVYGNGLNDGIATGLYRDLNPRAKDFDASDVREFWNDVLDEQGDGGWDLIDNRDYAQGFVDGALAIWEQVKDNLD